MPLREYECRACKVCTEELVNGDGRQADGTEPHCDVCGRRLWRVVAVGKTSFKLQGRGWAKDGYGAKTKPRPPRFDHLT